MKAINDDIAIKGSTLIVGIKFPPVDDTYTFTQLMSKGAITAKYYITNTTKSYAITNLYKVLESTDPDYDNMYAFTVDTTNLTPGVLMVEITATIPAHNNLPERIEIARCSTGIAIVE